MRLITEYNHMEHYDSYILVLESLPTILILFSFLTNMG